MVISTTSLHYPEMTFSNPSRKLSAADARTVILRHGITIERLYTRKKAKPIIIFALFAMPWREAL